MHKVKEVERLTLKILERLNKDKVKSILVSKGVYPEILANQTKFNTFNEYGITIVSLSEDFRKIITNIQDSFYTIEVSIIQWLMKLLSFVLKIP